MRNVATTDWLRSMVTYMLQEEQVNADNNIEI